MVRTAAFEAVRDASVELRVTAPDGRIETLTAVDTMTFRETADGTEVHYVARFDFKGLAKLAAPFLGPAFKKLGDEAEKGMREALERL